VQGGAVDADLDAVMLQTIQQGIQQVSVLEQRMILAVLRHRRFITRPISTLPLQSCSTGSTTALNTHVGLREQHSRIANDC
jgi:hypothetical protein